MAGGRPQEYDYIQEAKDLEEWSKQTSSVCLYQFVYNKAYFAEDLSQFADKCPKFSSALKKAKQRIAYNRFHEMNLGKIKESAYHRSARLYDKMLVKQEDEDKDADIERKLKAASKLAETGFSPIYYNALDKTDDLVKNIDHSK